MTDVGNLRKKIDDLSLRIAELLLERRTLAEQVIVEKKKIQQPAWDLQREEELLQLLTEKLLDSEKKYIVEIFKTVFVCTRGGQ
jgi:chorismate mutase